MQSDNFLRAGVLRLLIVALSFSLHGCGGGPSAANVPNVVDRPSDVQSLVGGSPLNLSSTQIEAASARKIRQANRLHLENHDLDRFFGTISSNCRGTVCITRNVRISTQDLLAPPTEIAGIPIESDQESSPVMTYQGIPIAQARGQVIAPSRSDVSIDAVGLGGWLNYSAFGVSVAALFEEPRSPGYLAAVAGHYALGDSPGIRPNPGTLGTATWEGAMVAIDTEFRHAVIGKSSIQLDLAQMQVDVQMTDLWDINARARMPSLRWNDQHVNGDGSFGDRRTLQASFYGPNHEEAGGIFTTDALIGSFGARRP